MRVTAVIVACALVPAGARAAGGAGDTPAPVASGAEAPVIGGHDATAGKWPDVAAILFPGSGGEAAKCTGVLIAPTVVMTAGHCYDPSGTLLPDNVLIGATSLDRPEDGETIAIQRGIVFPDAESTEDVAVLVLARASTRPPRRLATGWARPEIADGAPVALVGFGAVNASGDLYVRRLQEGTTTITDFDCSRSSGCNAGAQPDGELGAGGMGVDTCPGDSGGPLYLMTQGGPFLAGVTSRGYADAQLPCSEGGIYERPDKIVAWVEATAGTAVAHGPEPTADPITAVHGAGGDTTIRVNDPRSDSHRFEITTPPAHGTARVRSDGAVRVCTDPAATPGPDAVTVTITDTGHAGRALAITIAVQIEDGTAPPTCDIDAFDDDGGCCDSGRSSGPAVPLTIVMLALVRRRRR
ncbi:MAG TPA: trypsin-like serine protease [Kofleriaceae bacterium]|nr:trypsin-like serine protease [Kofleriaceae bacterium]